MRKVFFLFVLLSILLAGCANNNCQIPVVPPEVEASGDAYLPGMLTGCR
jgi:uncharacterized lipoprotein YajG